MSRSYLLACTSAMLVALSSAASSQPATGAAGQSATSPRQPELPGQVSSLSPEALYRGWRARQLLGQRVKATDGRDVGSVRDIIVDATAKAAAVVVEGGGAIEIPEALYRLPWSSLDLTPGQEGIVANLSEGEQPQYALFPSTPDVPTLPREFRLGEIIGDYARLRTGYGYGVVTDAVFSKDGQMIAVLITRDRAAGGGTWAFPFYGATGPWDAGMSYFGLPFITEDQAREAGLRIEAKRFQNGQL